VSISDPPSCKKPNGNFAHVYITVRSMQAHIDPHADDNSSGNALRCKRVLPQPRELASFQLQNSRFAMVSQYTF
jgi:hypothetical protein